MKYSFSRVDESFIDGEETLENIYDIIADYTVLVNAWNDDVDEANAMLASKEVKYDDDAAHELNDALNRFTNKGSILLEDLRDEMSKLRSIVLQARESTDQKLVTNKG